MSGGQPADRARLDEDSAPPSTVPILLYHALGSAGEGRLQPYTVSREHLAAHLDHLLERGWQPITVQGLLDGLDDPSRLPGRPVVVTFDDGFADFAEVAVPLLSERSFPATVFVTGAGGSEAGWLGRRERRQLMSWQQVGDLDPTLIEVGSHTVTHPQLDLAGTRRVRREVRDSKALLEDRLQRPVETFAYPHGFHTPRVRDEVVAAGYRAACAVKNALSHPGDDRFALARVTIMDGTTVAELDDIVEGRSVARVAPGRRFRTRLHRLGRAVGAPA